MKTCTSCRSLLPQDEFGPNRRYEDGLQPYCRRCGATRQRESWARKSSAARREANLKRYGLSIDDYDQMFTAQEGLCAVCDNKDEGRTLHVDHCHATGKVRGLLCHKCNGALGNAGDSIDRLTGLISYLQAVT